MHHGWSPRGGNRSVDLSETRSGRCTWSSLEDKDDSDFRDPQVSESEGLGERGGADMLGPHDSEPRQSV
jgi:hypothetical protein